MQDVLSMTYWSGAWDRSSRRLVRDPCDQCPITQRVATMSPKWLIITFAMKVSDYARMLKHTLLYSITNPLSLLIIVLGSFYFGDQITQRCIYNASMFYLLSLPTYSLLESGFFRLPTRTLKLCRQLRSFYVLFLN